MRAFRSANLVRSCLRAAQRSPAPHAAYSDPYRIGILGTRGLSTPSNASPVPTPDAATSTSPLSSPVNRLLEPIGASADVPPIVNPQAFVADGSTVADGVPVSANVAPTNTTASPAEKVYADASDTAAINASAAVSENVANGAETVASTMDSTAGAVADAVGAADPSAVAQVAEAVTYSTLSETLLTPTYWILNSMHDSTGLAWWSTIAISTLLVRSVLVPVTIKIMQNSAKLTAIRPEMKARQEKIMELYKTGQQAKAQKMMKENQDFMRGAGVSPQKVLLGPLMQIPIFVSFFVAIRRMAATDPTFATGGLAWFMDLTLRDPYFIMPVLCGASLFAMFEYGSDGQSPEMMTPIMRTMMRFMAVGSVFATYWFPAAMFCYWLPNNLFSLGFNLIAKSKPMKSRLNLNVNLAGIPGTKEFMRAKRFSYPQSRLSEQQLANASASAAATYVMNKQSTATNEKPKLFSNKPKISKKSKKKATL